MRSSLIANSLIENESSQQLLIKYIFQQFQQSNLEYCIVGNTSDFPNNIDGDIDIVVSKDMLKQMPIFLFNIIKKIDGKLVQAIQHEVTAWYFVLSWIDKTGNLLTIRLDICSDYVRKRNLILDAEEILDSKVKIYNEEYDFNYFISSAHVNFIYYFVKRLGKKSITDNHIKYLNHLYFIDTARVNSYIHRFWEAEDAVKLIHWIINNKWCNIQENYDSIYNKSIKKVSTKVSLAQEILRILLRVKDRTGISIAFLGPDGCGKSTVINQIEKNMEPIFRKYSYTHFRPKVFEKKDRFQGDVTNPYALEPRGFLSSNLKAIYFLIDYLTGYAIRYLPLLTSSTLVVFDRYFHDILVDPIRYRHGGSKNFIRMISKVIPRPKIFIVLNAPAEILQSRKQEVNYNESFSQSQNYYLFAKENNLEYVTTDKPINQVFEEVCGKILMELETRIIIRFNLEGVEIE